MYGRNILKTFQNGTAIIENEITNFGIFFIELIKIFGYKKGLPMAEPLRAPISLSRYDQMHDTSQKTVIMHLDFRPCLAKRRGLGQFNC